MSDEVRGQNPIPMKLTDRLNRRQAADLLGVSCHQLNQMRRDGEIQAYYASPRKIYYNRAEIVALLRARMDETGMLFDDCE